MNPSPQIFGQESAKTLHLLLTFRVLQTALRIAERRGGILTGDFLSIVQADDEQAETYTSLWNLDPQFAAGNKFNPRWLSTYIPKAQGGSIAVQFSGLLIGKVEVSTERIKEIFAEIALRQPVSEVIIISPAKLSTSAQRDMEVLSLDLGVKTTFFIDTELTSNPLTHSLTPIHEKIVFNSPEERKSFIRQLKVLNADSPERSLPRMKDNDPIAKIYGYEPGDIIRITTTIDGIGLTCPSIISYRAVVKAL